MKFQAKVLLALGSCIWAAPAMAQDAPAAQDTASEDGNPVGEILVTAQKRSETLSSVPLAVTAVSGEELSAHGAYHTSAIGFLHHNVYLTNETSPDVVFISTDKLRVE